MLFYVFIFLIPVGVWIVLMLVSRRKGKDEAEVAPTVAVEECALCHEEFPLDQLIEKEVGGYSRVYCFCGGCIRALYEEYLEKESTANTGKLNV